MISMRSLGFFILLAGIGVALFVYLPAPVDSGPSFEQVQRAARVAQLPQRFKPVARLSAFSPLIALTIPARRGTVFVSHRLTRRRRQCPSPPMHRPAGRRSSPQRQHPHHRNQLRSCHVILTTAISSCSISSSN